MTSINPQPETPIPTTKPRKGETLRSWLTRKNHALMFYSWHPELHFNDKDFGVIIPGKEILMAYDPEIKLSLQLKREFLVAKANELDLNCTGTKLELAVRIAKFQEEEHSKLWISISGGY